MFISVEVSKRPGRLANVQEARVDHGRNPKLSITSISNFKLTKTSSKLFISRYSLARILSQVRLFVFS